MQDQVIIEDEQINTLIASAGVETAQMILDAFWTSNEELLSAIGTHLQAGNFEELGKSAHALKGSAANLGAVQLSETARLLEIGAKASDNDAVQTAFARLEAEMASAKMGFESLLAKAAA